MFCEHEAIGSYSTSFLSSLSEGKLIRLEEQRMLEVEEVIGIVMYKRRRLCTEGTILPIYIIIMYYYGDTSCMSLLVQQCPNVTGALLDQTQKPVTFARWKTRNAQTLQGQLPYYRE